MTLATIKKKAIKAMGSRETIVSKDGDYYLIRVKLANGGFIAGGYKLNEVPDFENIAAQCAEADAKGEKNRMHIFDGSTTIFDRLFCNKDFTEISIPESVTKIEGYAFSECSGLESVEIPNSRIEILEYAFFHCKNLKKVVLPTGLTKIPEHCFMRCESLQEVVLNDSITEIDSSAFYGCKALKNIALPNGISSIKFDTFAQTALESIEIPDGVTTIGDFAFANCTSLKSITLPDSVTTIGEDAFWCCTSLKSITLPDGLTEIGKSAFSGCTSLKSITLPDGLTEIGDSAFRNTGLTEPILIGGKLVFVPSNMVEVIVPESTSKLSKDLFADNTVLTKLVLPSSLTVIPSGLCESCTSLVQVVIPDSVTEIGNAAFAHCTSLSSISLPKNLTSLGYCAFDKCVSLKSVEIPEGVEKIGNGTFCHCKALTTVKLPESLLSIDECAFSDTGLTELYLPSKVEFIGPRAFHGCESLKEVTIANGQMPLGVSDFRKDAFEGCKNISNVNLPKGITWGKIKAKFADSPWSESNPAHGKANAKKAKEEVTAEMQKEMRRERLSNNGNNAYLDSTFAIRTEDTALLEEIKSYLENLPMEKLEYAEKVFFVADLRPTPLMEKYGMAWNLKSFEEDMFIYRVNTVLKNNNELRFGLLSRPCVPNDIYLKLIELDEDSDLKAQTAYINTYHDEVSCRWYGIKGYNCCDPDGELEIDKTLMRTKWLLSVGYEPSAFTVKTEEEVLDAFKEAWELDEKGIDTVDKLIEYIKYCRQNDISPWESEIYPRYAFVKEIKEA